MIFNEINMLDWYLEPDYNLACRRMPNFMKGHYYEKQHGISTKEYYLEVLIEYNS